MKRRLAASPQISRKSSTSRSCCDVLSRTHVRSRPSAVTTAAYERSPSSALVPAARRRMGVVMTRFEYVPSAAP